MPALFSAQSSRPNSSTAVATMSITRPGSVTSTSMNSAVPPAARTSSAVWVPPGSSRSATTTVAPRAAKPTAVAPDETPDTVERPTAVALREAKSAADTARRKATAAHAVRVQAKRTWLDAEATYRKALTDRKRLTDAELRASEVDAAAEIADVR